MTAPVSPADFTTVVTREKLAVARSDLIDACNTVDVAVRACLSRNDLKPKALLGQNIEALRNLAAREPTSQSEKLTNLTQQLTDLNELRCDVVHASMVVVQLRGAATATFSNMQKQPSIGATARLLTLSDMRRCITELKAIAKKLEA